MTGGYTPLQANQPADKRTLILKCTPLREANETILKNHRSRAEKRDFRIFGQRNSLSRLNRTITGRNSHGSPLPQRLIDAVSLWTEEELDRGQLPHPVLGMVTMREMLFFTVIHNRLHAGDIERALAQ